MFGCSASQRADLYGGAEQTHDVVGGRGMGGGTGTGGVQPVQQGSGGFLEAGGSSGGVPTPIGSAAPPPPPPPPGSGGIGPIGTGGAGMIGGAGGVAPVSPDGGKPPDPPPPPPPPKCSYAGTWGTLIRVPVTWPDSPLVLYGGKGDVLQWNISHRVQDSPTTYHEATSLCGIYLPDLSGAVLTSNQKFGIRFPDSIWDQGGIPPVTFTTTVTSVGNDVRWVAGPIALLTGLTMQNPTTTPWPDAFPTTQTPDQDNDGSPGVTVIPVDPSTDPSYNWPPVGLPPYLGADYPRAAKISVVVRTVSKLRGTITGCDEAKASVDIVDIDGTPALSSMVIACTKTDGQVCSQSEAVFLNTARPQFTPSGPGTLRTIRLPDAATCVDVRRELPQ